MTECSECPGLFSLFLPLLDDFSLSEHYSHLHLYLLDKSRQHVPVNKRVSLKDTLLGSLRNTSGTKGVGPMGKSAVLVTQVKGNHPLSSEEDWDFPVHHSHGRQKMPRTKL